MRSFTDENKCVAWIFDEYTHPKGLHYKEVKTEQPKVVVALVPKPVVAIAKPKKK